MRGRYFRYIFENLDGGLFHTGSIYDKEKQKIINYIYMVGSGCRSALQTKEPEICINKEKMPEVTDILIVGSYSARYLNILIHIVKNYKIGTIILPYLAPIQRLVLVEEMEDCGIAGKDVAKFLQDPFLFLKESGIENIYFLFGNSAPIEKDPEELDRGVHFERADSESMQLIYEMEGNVIPVVHAGYMIENEWIFYFGVYGLDIQILSNFTREYFSHIENIHKISENANEDYTSQMKRLIQEFRRKFSNSPVTTVTMYEGPLHTSPGENDSYMVEKEFNRKERCELWARCQKDSRCTCSISCIYGKDHDNIQHHKRGAVKPKFGMLMFGNANLNRYFYEIMNRYLKVIHQIRGIGVPNCGCGADWNHQILEVFNRKDRMYWICCKHDITSAGVVSDIVLSASNNRFLPVAGEWGCCLSGYIIPKDEMD